MRRTVPMMLVLLASATVAAAIVRGRPAARPIDRLAWLTGCWALASGSRVAEEQWMRPRAGTMLGVARSVRGDSTVAWEFLRIVERGAGLAYVALPSGQRETEFAAVRITDSTVVFENPTHAFPQRILYRRVGDALHARAEGEHDGRMHGSDYPFTRVSCDAAEP